MCPLPPAIPADHVPPNLQPWISCKFNFGISVCFLPYTWPVHDLASKLILDPSPNQEVGRHNLQWKDEGPAQAPSPPSQTIAPKRSQPRASAGPACRWLCGSSGASDGALRICAGGSEGGMPATWVSACSAQVVQLKFNSKILGHPESLAAASAVRTLAYSTRIYSGSVVEAFVQFCCNGGRVLKNCATPMSMTRNYRSAPRARCSRKGSAHPKSNKDSGRIFPPTWKPIPKSRKEQPEANTALKIVSRLRCRPQKMASRAWFCCIMNFVVGVSGQEFGVSGPGRSDFVQDIQIRPCCWSFLSQAWGRFCTRVSQPKRQLCCEPGQSTSIPLGFKHELHKQSDDLTDAEQLNPHRLSERVPQPQTSASSQSLMCATFDFKS